MKIQKHKLLLFVSIFIFTNSIFSQELKTELYLTPFSIQSNKIIETGTPIGEFNLENIHTYEVGGRLKYKFKNNIGLGIEVNYNQTSYKYDYLMVEPNSPFLLHFSKTNFSNNLLGVSPTLFYEFNKLSFALSYEFNTVISSKGIIMNNSDAELGESYQSYISHSFSDNSQYSFSENAKLGASNSHYSISKLVIGYKILDNLIVFGSVKYKLLGDRNIYNMDVEMNINTPSAQEYNVQVINQPLFLQAGFSYDIKIE